MADIVQDKDIERAAIEIWFADEARIGRKNKIVGRWAKRGMRPAAPSRSAHRYDLYLRCDLPWARQRGGAGSAPM